MKPETTLFSPEWAERAINGLMNDARVKKTKARIHLSPAVMREYMEMAYSNGCYIGEQVFWNAMDAASKKFNQEKNAWRSKLRKRIEGGRKVDLRKRK